MCVVCVCVFRMWYCIAGMYKHTMARKGRSVASKQSVV